MKTHKMDRYLVSKQPWELRRIEKKFSCTKDLVLAAIKEVGHGRQIVYRYIRVHLMMDILKKKQPVFYKEMNLILDRAPRLTKEIEKGLKNITQPYMH